MPKYLGSFKSHLPNGRRFDVVSSGIAQQIAKAVESQLSAVLLVVELHVARGFQYHHFILRLSAVPHLAAWHSVVSKQPFDSFGLYVGHLKATTYALPPTIAVIYAQYVVHNLVLHLWHVHRS